MRLEFLTPLAGLVALVCLIPAAALFDARARAGSRRHGIGLPEPRLRAYVVPVTAVLVTAAALGLAAMQPVVSLDESRRVRTDVEAFVAIDTTRSMLASESPGSRARIDRAKLVAAAVQEALPTVPVGLASVTDRALPHLFPSADGEAFLATLDKAIGIERPPPVHTFTTRVTNLESLSAVATQGFYSPTAQRRVLVIVTDGETLPGARARLAQLFGRPPGISTVFVHVWGREERVFRGRTPEPAYRADPGARPALERLARELGGGVYGESELVPMARRVSQLVGSGPSSSAANAVGTSPRRRTSLPSPSSRWRSSSGAATGKGRDLSRPRPPSTSGRDRSRPYSPSSTYGSSASGKPFSSM
jgi:hypothetical protein